MAQVWFRDTLKTLEAPNDWRYRVKGSDFLRKVEGVVGVGQELQEQRDTGRGPDSCHGRSGGLKLDGDVALDFDDAAQDFVTPGP